jgi:translocation and assembly module TamB
MRRVLRITAWTCGVLVALLLLVIAAVLVIGNTDRGRELIVKQTARLSAGRVRMRALSGSFPAAIELAQLQLADKQGVWLTAEGITLRWSPLALLAHHVDIATLQVARLDVERAPHSESSSGPSSSPRIDIEQFTIGTLLLGPELTSLRAKLTVSGTAHLRSLQDAALSLVARRIDGITGDYELTLRFDPARMDAKLQLAEPAGGTLESLVGIPGLGALSLVATLAGPRGAERLDFAARAGQLQARAAGTLDLTRVSADLNWDLDAPAMMLRPGLSWQRIGLHGRWQGPLADARVDARFATEALEAGGVRLATLAGSLQASGGDLSLHASAGGIVLPGPKPDLLAASPVVSDAVLHVHDPQRRVQLEATHRLFRLSASVATAGTPEARFDLKVPELASLAKVLEQELHGSGDIRGQVRFGASATHIELDAATALAQGATLASRLLSGTTRLHLAAAITPQTLDLERLSASGRYLSLSAAGRARRGGGTAAAVQAVQGRYEVTLSDLAPLSKALAGSASAKGTLNGPLDALATQLQVNANLAVRDSPREAIQASIRAKGLPARPSVSMQVHGELAGAPLQFAASLERTADGTIRAVIPRSTWKSALVQADLTLGADFAPRQGTLRARMEHLADLAPLFDVPLTGRLAVEASAAYEHQTPAARIRLDAEELDVHGVAGSAHLSAAGTLKALALHLDAQSPDLSGHPASINASARLDLDQHVLTLRHCSVHYREQTLRLLAAANLRFANEVEISPAKLGVQHALLEIQGQFSPQLDLRGSVHQLDANLVNAFVPQLLASGSFDAEAQIAGSFSAPTGRITAQAKGVRLEGTTTRELHALDAHASADLQGKQAQLDARLEAGAASHLTLSGSAPLAATGSLDLQIAGSLDAALANAFLETRGERASGTLRIQAKVTATPKSPAIAGTMDISDGDLRDYTQGLHLSAITAHLSGNQDTVRIESLVAQAAPGEISVTGTLGLLQPKMPLELQLTARNAQPITSDLLTTNLDATLKASGNLAERLDLSGTIHLHRTLIGIPNALPPDVAVLDVRRPGQAAPPPQGQLVIGLDLLLQAPREILVQGRGLNAELGGELQIHGTSASPRVSGSFGLIRGTFALASTQLNFTDGHVSFNGAGLSDRIDPSLDFTAQATAANATVTLHVTGLATAPQFTLSSVPTLPEDEILARLLFGVSASQLSALQIAQIGVALASLSGVGGGGPNPLARVQKALGLDRLSLGSGTTNPTTGQSTGAALEAGRYVSSRVFVGAKQSTTGYSQVEVDVDLTKHLKLQTRLGNGTAIQGTTPDNDPGSTIGFVYQLEY